MKRFVLKTLFTITVALILSPAAFSAIKLPALIGDSMVLQQKASDPIWGWADPGTPITVRGSWPGSVAAKATADASGKWEVRVKTPAAGGPYTLSITGKETIVLHNILIGEVWVCSGQSNMEMPVSGWPGAPLLHSAEEIQDAKYPRIRLFTVKKDIALSPLEDCSGEWAACSPSTVGSFSATAFFFGRELYRKLGVPIGLIHTSWGGTVAEAWTSEPALRKLGDFNAQLDKIDSVSPHLAEMEAAYRQQTETWNAESGKVNPDYEKSSYDDGSWKTMSVPSNWESEGYPDLDGVVWFRRQIAIPASWEGKKLVLELGPIDDEDITFFNGEKIGGYEKEGYWAQERRYEIPASLVKAGTVSLAVRVTDIAGNGGIDGKTEQLKIFPADDSTAAIPLAGDWKYHIELVKPVQSYTNNPNTPTVLYNGMIAPVIPFGIRGAIWYQGESNVGRAAQYARLFPAMITDWRQRWKEGDFPFYFVQIAPYPYGGDLTKGAALRDAQRLSLSTPNTGMAVTLDIGNVQNIHPANKQEVGRRLSLWALARTYGKKDIVYSGPLFDELKIDGSKAIVSFRYAGGGLVAKGGDLKWFEIAGADGKFVAANAVISGSQVIVSSPDVPHPTAVRYAWKDTAEPHLCNKAGLPASSFSSLPLR